MITLEPLSERNLQAVAALEVAFEQAGFVAPNVFSMAEAKGFGYMVPRVLYSGRKAAGFALYGQDPESDRYYIVRLMIDASFQGRGLGREAVRRLVAEIVARNGGPCSIYMRVLPGNVRIIALCEGMGFEATGEEDGGEHVYRLDEEQAAQMRNAEV